jgi:hypothetical protein
MRTNLFLTLLFFWGFSLPAFADIYLEPSFGYAVGSGTTSFTQTAPTLLKVDDSYTSSGLVAGTKLGASLGPLSAGLDAMYFGMATNGAVTKEIDLGVFAQVTTAFKFGFSYYPSAQYMMDSGAVFSGSSFRLGAGFPLIPWLYLNFDYYSISQTDASMVGGVAVKDLKKAFQGLIVSLSLPLAF